MIEQVNKLELDATMSNPDNFIPNEQHSAESKVIVARFGGFFMKSLSVTQGGTPLIRGVNYKLIAYSAEASRFAGQAIYYGIVLMTTSSAPVVLNYHALGAQYCSYVGVIVDMINELNLVDDIVRASDIVGLPSVFPPGPHATHGDDLIGLDRVVEMLARIDDAITTGNPATLEALRRAIDGKVNAVGSVRLNPTDQAAELTSPLGVATLHDLTLPRSETSDATVLVELTFMGDEGISNATIAYTETATDVSNVEFVRADAVNGSVAQFGVAKVNGERTVIRLRNPASVKPFKRVFVKSIMSIVPFEAENKVIWLSTPSEVGVTLRPF